MATITISGGDIQSQINATSSGDTIQFSGILGHSSTLTFPGNRHYLGLPGSKLTWSGSSTNANAHGVYVANNASSWSIKNMTFAGNGLKIDYASNFTFTGNRFENINQSGDYGNAMSIRVGCSNAVIDSNVFYNIKVQGMYFFNLQSTSVQRNKFTIVWEPIHITWFGNQTDVRICLNEIDAYGRHGIECQSYGNPVGIICDQNYIRNGIGNHMNVVGYRSHMAISWAMYPSTNCRVTRNILIGRGNLSGEPSPDIAAYVPNTNTPNYLSSGIEVMGINVLIEDNYIQNFGWGLLIGQTDSASWTSRNNTFVDIGTQVKVLEYRGTYPATSVGDKVGVLAQYPIPSHPLGTVQSTPVITSAPSGLTCTPISTTAINLSWTDNSTNESAFVVERKVRRLAGAVFAPVFSNPTNDTTFSDTGLEPSWEYTYRVGAVGANNAVTYSAEVHTQTHIPSVTATTPPAVPTGLSATAITTTSIQLTWTDASSTETGFYVEWRLTSGSTYTVVPLAAGATTHTVTGLTAATNYTLRVGSYNTGGTSYTTPLTVNTANSTPVTPPAPVTIPAAPTGLTGQALTYESIKIDWNDAATTETSFSFEYKLPASGTWTATAIAAFAGTGAMSRTVTGLTDDTEYEFRVGAVNAGGTAYTNKLTLRTLQNVPVPVDPNPDYDCACPGGKTQFRISGDWRDKKLWIGQTYTMVYRLSQLQLRRDQVAVTSGRLQLRNLSLAYNRSGYFRVETTPTGRSTQVKTYSSTNPVESGVLRVPINSKNDQVVINIVNDSALPCWFTSAEWEGEYVSRARPV